MTISINSQLGEQDNMVSTEASRRAVLLGGAVLGSLGAPPVASAKPMNPATPVIEHKRIQADGVEIFYREAGRRDAPVLLLLHGFANSSFYFRHLMPMLADRFRMIAPDIPSFGFTDVPTSRNYEYTFASLSKTLVAFVDALNLKRYTFYVFDYGAPIAWELALVYPERVSGIITQNGNAYVEGLGDKTWAPLRAYWASPKPEYREAIRSRMTLDGVKAAYFQGVADPRVIEPESYTLDAAILARPGNADLQIDLKLDYKSNIERYPLYQGFFRKYRPRTLVTWGANDLYFIPPGASAFKRDIPDARIVMLDTGHFALETHVDAIAAEIRKSF